MRSWRPGRSRRPGTTGIAPPRAWSTCTTAPARDLQTRFCVHFGTDLYTSARRMPGGWGRVVELSIVLPSPCLVVLVGASGAGKSSWAAEQFASAQVGSSARLRAVIGEGEEDLSASEDAFALLDQIVAHRARRRLTTVIDTLGLDPDRRAGWLRTARDHGLATAAVVFATPVGECRARNRARGKPVPDGILSQQVKRVAEQRAALDDEDLDAVLDPVVVRTAPAAV